MQSATYRRQLLLEYLSDNRETTLKQLAEEFDVSKRTIQRDLEILAREAPILSNPGVNGGVTVMEGWYLSRRYLHDDQEALLRRLMETLPEDDRKMMQGILKAYARPKAPEQ